MWFLEVALILGTVALLVATGTWRCINERGPSEASKGFITRTADRKEGKVIPIREISRNRYRQASTALSNSLLMVVCNRCAY